MVTTRPVPTELTRVVELLTDAFAGVFAPETVRDCVVDRQLRASAEGLGSPPTCRCLLTASPVSDFGPVGSSRDRYRSRCRSCCSSARNTRRSQLAAALLARAAGNWVLIASAGTAPASAVAPAVLEVLGERSIDQRRLPQAAHRRSRRRCRRRHHDGLWRRLPDPSRTPLPRRRPRRPDGGRHRDRAGDPRWHRGQGSAAPHRTAPHDCGGVVLSTSADIDLDSDLIRVLADPVRAAMVRALAAEQLCTCHLVEITGARQTNVSNHLRVLREAGVVEAQPAGRYTDQRPCPRGVGRGRYGHERGDARPIDPEPARWTWSSPWAGTPTSRAAGRRTAELGHRRALRTGHRAHAPRPGRHRHPCPCATRRTDAG
jgi:ArsR family transcriptional regulator, arsenate/arsenite/antimonite-responsive transcriptional repressor